MLASTVLGLSLLSACSAVGAVGNPASAYPPLPDDVASAPLGQPEPAPPGSGGYAVLDVQPGSGEPVGWDPCRPIRYVVNRAGAPPAADYLLADAVAEVQRVTGLVMVLEATTDEVPGAQRPLVQVDRYGQRWAPVLVSWSDPVSAPYLAGPVAGYAGPQAVDGAGQDSRRYVTGEVVLDGPQLAEMAAGSAGLARARAVLLHELVHLVGLDHVNDPSQLMHPSTTPLVVDLGDGDRRGLAAVSGRPCHRDF